MLEKEIRETFPDEEHEHPYLDTQQSKSSQLEAAPFNESGISLSKLRTPIRRDLERNNELAEEESIISDFGLQTSHDDVQSAMKATSTPIKLSFKDLDYKVYVKNSEELHILKKVSGYVLPGQTNFIIGSSGAGKTTLLNALSGRIRVGRDARLGGSLLCNDSLPLTSDTFSRYGCYVM